MLDSLIEYGIVDCPLVLVVTGMKRSLQQQICRVLVACLFVPSVAFCDWTDITPVGVKYTNGKSIGIAMVDIDNDGDDDLIMSTGGLTGDQTLLFLNDGKGNFTNATQGVFAEHHSVWSPLFGDSDNDGDLDMFFVAFGEQCRLFENDGETQFVELSSNDLFENAGNMMARGGAWVDFDSDGLLDIMVSTNSGKPDVGSDKLYRNMGDNIFEDVTPEVFGHKDVGRGVAWCDFDNDGDLDLYAAAGKGCPCNWEEIPPEWLEISENRMYRNDNGELVDVTNELTVDNEHGRGVAAGDYDNDGDLDLYICNIGMTGQEGDNPQQYYGPNKLLRNDGNFQFTDVTPTVLKLIGGERSCAWFDMDNDGDLDLVMTSMWNSAPTVGLFENVNAGENFIAHDEVKAFNNDSHVGNSGTGMGISDIDNDGDLDLMFAFKFGPNLLARNDLKSQNKWIKINLEGTVSNRSAVGARVTVKTGSLSQIREIQTGTGYWSQHSFTQHIGLNNHEIIDEIQIRWPSGIVQILTDVAVNQTIDIVEHEGCATDLVADGYINVDDLLELISQWGLCGDCSADFDNNSEVDIDDLLILIGDWGVCN